MILAHILDNSRSSLTLFVPIRGVRVENCASRNIGSAVIAWRFDGPINRVDVIVVGNVVRNTVIPEPNQASGSVTP